MRGKQAAAAANRRADAAEAQVVDLKKRLRAHKVEHAAENQALKDEIGQLKTNLIEEAARLGAKEIARLKEKIISLTAELSEASEIRRQEAKARDYLMRNMCKYVSMTRGLLPSEAVSNVITWLTNEPFSQKSDTAVIADRLGLPMDGWVMTELRRSQTLMVNESALGHEAVPLDQVDEDLERFAIHKDYRPVWYEKMRAPRLGRPNKSGVAASPKHTIIMKPRRTAESEEG